MPVPTSTPVAVSAAAQQLALHAASVRVPAALDGELTAAVADADRTFTQLAARGGPIDPTTVAGLAAERLAGQPHDAHRAQELATIHQMQRAATPDERAAAAWYGRFGFPKRGEVGRPDVWQAAVRELGMEQSPALHAALDGASLVYMASKKVARELRPFAADPTLDQPANSAAVDCDASHPSGHAAGSFAMARVLAEADPSGAITYDALARRIAWARVLEGYHYPHDVVLGAWLGRLQADVAIHNAAIVTAPA